MNHAQFWGGAAAPYEIEQSLRFNSADSAYLNRTPSSAGNQKTWTFSVWLKRSQLKQVGIFCPVTGGDGSNESQMRIKTDNKFQVYDSGGAVMNRSSLQLFRDPSAWFHLVVAVDTTQATDTNRVKIYVNGSQIEASDLLPGQNANLGWNNTSRHDIGRYAAGAEDYFDGYMAEMHHIDGTQLDPDSFGEFDDNGVWRPIQVSGVTYGTNGFYLKFDPTATNGIGHDHSGNGNNWTPTGFTTSGTGTDVMSDTPTTNWATLNPLWNPIEATYAEGNLKFTGGATHSPSVSSISASSGKFYFEATALSGSLAKWSLGVIDTAIGYRKSSGNNYIPGLEPTTIYTDGDALSLYNNNLYRNGSTVVTGVFSGGAVAAGDVVQMAVDIDAGEIWFGIDGTWSNGGGTEGAFNSSSPDTTFTANDDYIFHFTAESCGWEVNFGQRAFAYTPPTGFKALNTSNLPAPDIADGSQYFNTVLYTGDGTSSRAITGMGFQADFLWLKPRSTRNHSLVDVLRGTNHLQSNNTNAEASVPSFDSFDSDGFTVTADGSTNPNWNESPEPNVVWGWLAGGSGSSNNAGSITSTVSVNATAGFSIVSFTGKTYTGNSSTDTGTVGHGLGVPPSFYVVKARNGSSDWICYHSALGNTKYIELNQLNTVTTNTGMWASTSPTDTVFTMGPFWPSNIADGKTMIAYCFAEVEGYSKIGQYRGNSSNDGTFVYTGFTPSFILVKGNLGQDWFISDTARDPYNVGTRWLRPNLSDSEVNDPAAGGSSFDILSNGFKWRTNTFGVNRNYDYYYIAFASNPFGGSGVSPATAR